MRIRSAVSQLGKKREKAKRNKVKVTAESDLGRYIWLDQWRQTRPATPSQISHNVRLFMAGSHRMSLSIFYFDI